MTRKRTITKQVEFRNPVKFSTIGFELPPGSYVISTEEHDIPLQGQTNWQIMRCSISIPESLLSGDVLGADAVISNDELMLKIIEDKAKR